MDYMSLRKKHIQFIEHLREKTGLTYTALAHKADIADSTLTRFVNKPDFPSLSSATLDKIAKVGGYRSYEDYLLNKGAENHIEFSDSEKFEIYDMVKNLLIKKDGAAKPEFVRKTTDEVLKTAKKLNTRFVSESLIMYVLEVVRSASASEFIY